MRRVREVDKRDGAEQRDEEKWAVREDGGSGGVSGLTAVATRLVGAWRNGVHGDEVR